MYATVEESVYGHATVRLASNGARMTMLPVLTASVEVGERVILDYSAEGQPFVRPLTVMPTEVEEPVAEGKPEEYEDLGLIAARITTTGRKPFQTYYYVPQGFGYDVHKEGLPWDKIAWETQEGLVDVDSGGDFVFRAPEDGKYLVRYCVGIETTNDSASWDGNVMFYVYQKYWNGFTWQGMGARQHRRYVAQKSDGVDVVIASGMCLVHLAPESESGFFRQTVDVFVQVECQMPWYYWYDPRPYVGIDTAFAYKEGCYPIIEIYKVAQTAGILEANFDHWWWKYW